jgi:hypothetical protein
MNLFSSPKLKKETKIIVALIFLMPALQGILISIKGEIVAPILWSAMEGALIGMLFMHLHDVRKYKKE